MGRHGFPSSVHRSESRLMAIARAALHPFLILVAFTFASACRGGVVQVDGRTFKLPDGFTMERVAGPPVIDRPIVADFDEMGRLYVADSSGYSEDGPKQLEAKAHRIVRLDAADKGGVFHAPVTFAERVSFPEGVLWYAGALNFVAIIALEPLRRMLRCKCNST